MKVFCTAGIPAKFLALVNSCLPLIALGAGPTPSQHKDYISQLPLQLDTVI